MPDFGKVVVGQSSFSREQAVHGILSGSATVEAGGHLILHGILTGDLIIKENGKASIHGIVEGHIANFGELAIHGIAERGYVTRPGGTTSVAADAIISGKRFGER